MKRFLYVLILILVVCVPRGTFAQDTSWTTITTTNDNYDESRAVAVLSDGSGYVMCGYEYNGTDEDVAVLKYNTSGTLLWQFTWDGVNSGDDRAYSICETPDGNVAIVGYVEDSGGDKDGLLMKLDSSNGDSLWSQTYGNPSDYETVIKDVACIASDSGFVLCGGSQDYGGHGYEFYIIRTDSLGDTVYVKHWIPPTDGDSVNGKDIFQTVIITSTGHIVAGGYTRSTAWNGGITTGNSKAARGLIAKLELDDADSVWFRHFDCCEYYSEIYTVRELGDSSGYVACGGEQKFKPSNYNWTTNYHMSGYIINVDTTGVLQWRTHAPNFSTREFLWGLVELDDGTFFCTGHGKVEDSSERDETDALAVLFDSSGTWLYSKYYGGSDGDQFFMCEYLDSNHVLIPGVYGKDAANYTTANGNHWITKFRTKHIKMIGVAP